MRGDDRQKSGTRCEQQVLHLSQQIGVEDLEDLVESKLAEALHGVANHGRGPPLTQGPHALLRGRQSQSLEHVAVLGGVHLNEWGTMHRALHTHTHTYIYQHRGHCNTQTLHCVRLQLLLLLLLTKGCECSQCTGTQSVQRVTFHLVKLSGIASSTQSAVT